MRDNTGAKLVGAHTVLVPYKEHHVEVYHGWMQSAELQAQVGPLCMRAGLVHTERQSPVLAVVSQLSVFFLVVPRRRRSLYPWIRNWPCSDPGW